MLSRKQALLKLDIDRTRKPDLDRMAALLARAGYETADINFRRSPSGKGWHVILEIEPRPRTPMEVIALEAILGADPFRQAMQINRGKAMLKAPGWMRDAWNVLYVPDKRRARHLRLQEGGKR